MNRKESTQLLSQRLAAVLILTAVQAFTDCPGADLTANLDLAELSVEELAQVKITSVSKHSEVLQDAAAAIHVLTQEDIQRQGFRTIADSLRTVPGMQVAQINSHTWGVSSRGFNGEYATKLLVLMDGRSVYTPLFAGVYWDAVDMMLEDVERIEVIRGPGATLWGANAVNGVINIISKSARDTQGWLATGGGGSEEQGFGAVRYGGKLGDAAHFRVYGKYDNHDAMALSDGQSAQDDWWMARSGFRLDWEPSYDNLVTVQGDLYAGREDWLYTLPVPNPPYTQTQVDDENVFGANALGRWTHTFDETSEFKLQTYFDHTERESNLPKEQRDTFDLELQQRFSPMSRHDVVMGLGYRLTSDSIRNNFANTLTPPERTLHLYSAFVQDEIMLIEDRLRWTLGSKFEHNDFTGMEYQPGTRLAWTPTDRQTVWGSIARAVRTPSRAEEDIRINRPAPSPPFPPGSIVSILGNHAGESETLIAYEVGYRIQPYDDLALDLATFYNVYDELRSLEPGAPPADPPPPLATFHVQNELEGESWGAEIFADWQMLDWWRWRGGYTYFHLDLHQDGSTDVQTIQLLEGNAPRHQFSLRSQMDLPHKMQFDAGMRFVDSLENPHVPAYVTVDLRWSWKPSPDVELSVVGLNLVEARHAEFYPTQVDTPPREVQRSVYAQLTCRF